MDSSVLDRQFRNYRWVLILSFAFTCGAWVCLEDGNTFPNTYHDDGMLQSYYREYKDGGSWKWRGAEGNAFHNILLFACVPAYLTAIISIVVGLFLTCKVKDYSHKLFAVFFAIPSFFVLWRFSYLGVWSAAFE